MNTKNIQQEVFINASPTEIYNALMDSKIHSQFTEDVAEIGKSVGEKFSAFNGYATGENLVLKPNELIKQTWRASDWPNGHYSIVKFELSPKNEGTILVFNQTDIPADQYEDISNGWHEYYWKPLNAMFKNK